VVSYLGVLLKGFNITSVTKVGTGLYCIGTGNGISTANSAALATLDWSDPVVATGDDVQVLSETAFNTCSPTSQFQVRTANSSGTLKDDGFDFMVP
jgi:hypothetical protein